MTGFLADLLLGCAAFGAAAYCLVLSRRLARLRGTETGIGASLAALAGQTEELAQASADALRKAEEVAGRIAALDAAIARADGAARRLELLMAASEAGPPDAPSAPPPAPEGPQGPIFRRRAPVAA